LPIGSAHHAATQPRSAAALELVVVDRVAHRVVEAELFAGRDVAPRHQQNGTHEPAGGIARMVHEVGGIERRRARKEQVVVDLDRMLADVSAELDELGGVDCVPAEGGNRRSGRNRRGRKNADTLRGRVARLRARMEPRLAHGGKLVEVNDTTVTLFELVGGQSFFDALVNSFYDKVEADAGLRALYPPDLEPGKRSLALFLGQYWGGPPVYSEEKGHPRLRMRHAPFAIDAAARDAWLTAMLSAVESSDAPDVARAALREYFEMASEAMINRPSATMDA